MLEIILGVYGLYVLFTGKLKLSAEKVVEGTPARLLALIMLAPFPIAFAAGMAIGVWSAANGQEVGDLGFPLMAVEVVIVIVCAALAFGIAHAIAKPPGFKRPEQFAGFGANPQFPPPPSDPNNPYQPPSI